MHRENEERERTSAEKELEETITYNYPKSAEILCCYLVFFIVIVIGTK